MHESGLSMAQWALKLGCMEAMGAEIRRAREARRSMRVQDLADAIGKAPSFVSKLETGAMKEMVPPEELNAIGDALGVPVSDLLRRAGYNVDRLESEPDEAAAHVHAIVDQFDWTQHEANIIGEMILALKRPRNEE